MRAAVTCIAFAASLVATQAFAQTSPPSDPRGEDTPVEAHAPTGVRVGQDAGHDAAAIDDTERVAQTLDAPAAPRAPEDNTGNQQERARAPAAALTAVKRAEAKDNASSTTAKGNARLAAVGDSVSTLLAVSAGAAELNPLITPTPGGLLLVAALKFGLIEMVDALPDEQRQATHRSLSAMWGAASVSNLLIATSVTPPVAAVVGIAAGLWLWQQHRESTNAGDANTATARASEDTSVAAKAASGR